MARRGKRESEKEGVGEQEEWGVMGKLEREGGEGGWWKVEGQRERAKRKRK